MSYKCLTCINKFDVYDDPGLPSDQCVFSPLWWTLDREWMLRKVQRLGDHAVLHSSHNDHLQKAVKFSKINVEQFLAELSLCGVPDLTDNVDADI